MALQVWLPLNGDLTQQGLSGVEATNNGATLSSSIGKLGQSYSFNGSNSILIPEVILPSNSPEWSFSCWFYLINNTSTAANCLFSERTAGTPTGYTIFLYPNSGQMLVDDGVRWTVTPMKFSATTWYHLAITRNSEGKKIYVNGIETNSTNTIGTTTGCNTNGCLIGLAQSSTSLTTGNQGFNGNLNDVRIYDHCLSAKEVKELSKGLVLHYKLDGKEETSSNLITTEDGLSNTAYNAANGKYGYNADSNIAKIVGDFNGKHCTKVYMITEGQAARPYVYINSLFVSNGTAQPTYKALSFDYYGTIGTFLNHYKLGNGTGTAIWKNITTGQSGSFTNNGNILVTPNQWNRIEIILHGTTDANAEFGYFILGNQHTSSSDNYWLFANVQVEIKDHVTPYMGPGGSRNYTTEFDCSGYENNSSPIDVLAVSSDTARYSGSTFFDGTNDGILIEDLHLSNIINSEVTYSFWIKPNGENGARSVYFGSYTGTSWSLEKNTNNLLRLYWNGSPDEVCTGATITDEVWQHVCITKKGTSDVKVYINGEQKWTSTAAHNALTFPTTYRIGRDTRSGDGTPYKGLMSDFRIYATALSAEDVAELYHTAASVDNHGNVYAGELKEV